MFIVLLRFAANKTRAKELMDRHKAWLQQGFEDGVFLMAGSLQPNQGGSILANNTTMDALQQRVDEDPFVAERVVDAEILEITPSRAEERLAFLMT